jgi:small subunit ribosomal protein S7
MPRRAKIERRVPTPDARYNSELVARFINKIMQRGKKGLAESIMYDALQLIQEPVPPRRRRQRQPHRLRRRAPRQGAPAATRRRSVVGHSTSL